MASDGGADVEPPRPRPRLRPRERRRAGRGEADSGGRRGGDAARGGGATSSRGSRGGRGGEAGEEEAEPPQPAAAVELAAEAWDAEAAATLDDVERRLAELEKADEQEEARLADLLAGVRELRKLLLDAGGGGGELPSPPRASSSPDTAAAAAAEAEKRPRRRRMRTPKSLSSESQSKESLPEILPGAFAQLLRDLEGADNPADRAALLKDAASSGVGFTCLHLAAIFDKLQVRLASAPPSPHAVVAADAARAALRAVSHRRSARPKCSPTPSSPTSMSVITSSLADEAADISAASSTACGSLRRAGRHV